MTAWRDMTPNEKVARFEAHQETLRAHRHQTLLQAASRLDTWSREGQGTLVRTGLGLDQSEHVLGFLEGVRDLLLNELDRVNPRPDVIMMDLVYPSIRDDIYGLACRILVEPFITDFQVAWAQEEARMFCWCGEQVGPREPGDNFGLGCHGDIHHDWRNPPIVRTVR